MKCANALSSVLHLTLGSYVSRSNSSLVVDFFALLTWFSFGQNIHKMPKTHTYIPHIHTYINDPFRLNRTEKS